MPQIAPAEPVVRRRGDTVAIPGDYQFQALHCGPAVQRFWHDTKLWLVDRYLQPTSTDRVLDVGCGSGVVAHAIAQAGAHECVGLDGSEAAIAFASRQFRRPNLRFVQGLVDEIAWPDGSFDAACCMELIEHIHPGQALDLLSRLRRIIRPGGRLLVTTPNARSAWPVIEWLLDRSGRVPRLAGEQHVALYTHRRLAQLAAESGWSLTTRATCCTLAPWTAALSTRAARALREIEAPLPFGTLLVACLTRPEGDAP
jgi:2-polyprenyl-3-methyl-5-hydroxy-6-metoxy-1,4-benzoquinol methylase